MTILTPGAIALLKRMEAEEALEAAAKAGWNAAIEAAVKDIESRSHLSDHAGYFSSCVSTLKEQQ